MNQNMIQNYWTTFEIITLRVFEKNKTFSKRSAFMKLIFYKSLILFLISGTITKAEGWDSPDKAKKIQSQIPGQRLLELNPAMFMKDAAIKAEKNWKHPVNKKAFSQYSQKTITSHKIGNDEQIKKLIPSTISPFARIKSLPSPEIRPWLHWTGHFTKNQLESYRALIKYCPFCGSNNLNIIFDKNNCNVASTSCCKQKLYRNDFPSDYKLKPNSTANFLYLDDTVRKIPCTLFKDRQGRVWELFIDNIFNYRDWLKSWRDINVLKILFQRSGNPLYAYKAAVYLDYIKDTYYSLPLSLMNLNPLGKSGIGLSRHEWEDIPRPNTWAIMPKIGWWNRSNPKFARGWFNQAREGQPALGFALMRHNPAFKYYSKIKYGDSNKLEQEFIKKFCREVNLGFSSINMFGLITNYQAANYAGILACAILAQDKTLLEFVTANQEISIHNHHYSDGLNGEGSVGYQGMLRRQFYPYMNYKYGWKQIDPKFHDENPFFKKASKESEKQITARGLFFEHGDTYMLLKEVPNDKVNGNLQTGEKYLNNQKLPSRVWPSWGAGVIRVGSLGNRLETIMNFSRVDSHGGLMLGLASWFDGIPVIRPAGYAPPWANLNKDGVKIMNQLNFPRKVIYVPKATPSVHETWNRLLARSAIGQNTLTVNEVASVKRGLSEVICYKGGEKYNSAESKFQVLEINTINEFKTLGIDNVSKYKRALLEIETSSGRAYMLDFIPISGGKSQTVWFSVWGESINSKLPAKTKQFKSATEAFFKGKLPKRTKYFSPLIYYKWVYGIYNHITKLKKYIPKEMWFVDYKTDYYAYWRDAKGKKKSRKTFDTGVVNFRIAGLPVDDSLEIWRAKAPWSSLVRLQKTPSGEFIDQKTVVFQDGYDLLAQRRIIKHKKLLNNCFITLLEGRHPKQQPVVKKIYNIPLSIHNAKAIKVELTEHETDIIIYQENNQKLVLPDGLETDARYALVRYDKNNILKRIDMIRGNYIKIKDKLIQSQADALGTIININADITGDKKSSIIYVKPQNKWKTNTMTGKLLHILVDRKNGISNNEAFYIESAEKLSDGNIKIKLEGPAPLITSWHQAFKLQKNNQKNKIQTNRPIQKYDYKEWYKGTKAYFPRLNKSFLINKATLKTIKFSDSIDLAKEGIKDGDWFMINAFEPGQKVYIPQSLTKEF